MDQQVELLLEQIDIRDKEIEKLQVELGALPSSSAEPAAARIVELAKKNKSLSMNVSSLKAKVRKLEQDLETKSGTKAAAEATSSSGPVSSGGGDADTLAVQVAEWKNKFDSVLARFNDLQLQNTATRQENMKLRGLLQKETGEDPETISRLVRGETESVSDSWRGRAQQLTLLRAKLERLQQELQQRDSDGGGSASAETASVPTVSPKRAKERVEQRLEEIASLSAQIAEKDAQIQQLREKVDGLKSRVVNLENYNGNLRSKLQILIGKADNDDKLIGALRRELRAAQSGSPAAPTSAKTEDAQKTTSQSLSKLPPRLRELWNGLEDAMHQFLQLLQDQGSLDECTEVLRGLLLSSFTLERNLVSCLCGFAECFGSPSKDAKTELNSLRVALESVSSSRAEDLELFGVLRDLQQQAAPADAMSRAQELGGGDSGHPLQSPLSQQTDSGPAANSENEQLKVELKELKRKYNSLVARTSK